MNASTFQKHIHWYSVSLAVFIILLSVFYTRHLDKNNDTDKYIQRFESELNLRNQVAKEILAQLAASDNKESYLSIQNFSSRLPENFNLFVLKDNHLFYWSDNSLPVNIENADSLKHIRILKTGNGFYQVNSLTDGRFQYYLTDIIKSSFRYQNDYLTSKFNPAYSIPDKYEVLITPTEYPVKDTSGNALFYILPSDEILFNSVDLSLLTILYTIAYILLIFSIYKLYQRYTSIHSNVFHFVLFAIDILILRGIIFYFRIPNILYSSDFFSPVYFASSRFLPSLGDLFINSITILGILAAFYRHIYNNKQISTPIILINKVLPYIIFLISIASFYYCCYLIDTLIINSSFKFDPGSVMDFSFYSIIGFLIIAMFLAGFFLFTFPLLRFAYKPEVFWQPVFTFIFLNASIYFLSDLVNSYRPAALNLFALCLYYLIILLIRKGFLKFPHATTSILIVLVLTISSAYSVQQQKALKEHDERKLMAVRLSSDRDKLAEFLFDEEENKIKSDTVFGQLFMKAWLYPSEEELCINYIRNNYFKGFWTKYNVQVTLCYPEKVLEIKPSGYLIGCQDYFQSIISNIGEKTASTSLYFIRESYDASSYIANIAFGSNALHSEKAHLIIELNRKYVPKGLGYPELLLDKSLTNLNDISGYSYAIYFKNELVKNVGEYTYSNNESGDIFRKSDFYFYDNNGYNHLFHKINRDTSIIISCKSDTITDKLAPFTYQFIFHIILLLIATGLAGLGRIKSRRNLDLKTRLQIMLVSLILFSSISVGISTIYNIKSLNAKKNKDMLSEKAHSVLIEIENKLSSFDFLDHTQQPYLEELLTKFSMVFFSDINLYDKNGQLMASSRPQIFDEGLKSGRMTTAAYQQLVLEKRTLFIANEQIGNYNYLSAYLPFRNNQNKIIAYINLPYFAREQELRQEISSFLLAFLNIFVLLTALAVFISLLVGNFLTRPLQMIRNRFSSLNLNRTNEKIIYSRKDELGDLVHEYNLMVDKLEESAEKLARSERESAWREMARQVAHEIKNPLTPMKLSIQHLRKAYQEHAPDWETRLDKTTQTLVTQIDSLASIATAFSDFAKLPQPVNKKTEITTIIRSTLSLFNQHPDINFSFTIPEKECFVFADEKQLSRVFINLLNNSVQSIPPDKTGLITIKLEPMPQWHKIEITDNGIGIGEEEKSKIFSPNFTTKSGGMGLGLAMVKNIIDSANGKISFVSEKNKGTTFTIILPVCKD